MGYWSIMSSVDDARDDIYLTELSPADAIAALEQQLPRAGRVVCERTSEREIVALTVNYTPAWAFLGLVPLLFVRGTRRALIRVDDQPAGTAVHVTGQIDTRAAEHLRALRAA
jgi:hypothetical protein